VAGALFTYSFKSFLSFVYRISQSIPGKRNARQVLSNVDDKKRILEVGVVPGPQRKLRSQRSPFFFPARSCGRPPPHAPRRRIENPLFPHSATAVALRKRPLPTLNVCRPRQCDGGFSLFSPLCVFTRSIRIPFFTFFWLEKCMTMLSFSQLCLCSHSSEPFSLLVFGLYLLPC